MNERKDYFCSLPSKQVDAIIDLVSDIVVDVNDDQGHKVSADEYFQRQCDKALKMIDVVNMHAAEAKELIQAMKDGRRIITVNVPEYFKDNRPVYDL